MLIEGYVERMCFANSMTDSVMFGERFFLAMRMLRGGEGHCRLRSVVEGDCMYEGFMREGSSVMFLISRQRDVDEKLRAGCAKSRHGRTR